VRALVRTEQQAAALPRDVESVRGDLRDERSLREVVDGVDAVVHTAALLAGTDGALNEVNVKATRSLALMARDAAVGQFVLLSSSGVYGGPEVGLVRTEETPPKPHTAYGRSKYEAEQVAREALDGMACVTILRPSGIYGPRRDLYARLLRQLARKRLSLRFRGDEILHPCHIDDVVNTITTVLRAPPEGTDVFNVAGERTIPLEELHDTLCRLAGIRRRCLTIPKALAVAAVRLLAIARRGSPHALEVMLKKARGLFPSGELSTKRIESRYTMEWSPFDVGLRDMVSSLTAVETAR
jgi:nucleoside-diphosphate-sugar epimerase